MTSFLTRGIVITIAVMALLTALLFAASGTARFVLLSLVQFARFGYPDEKDRQDAEELIRRVETVHNFELNSRSEPAKPPVFAGPSSRGIFVHPAFLTIYGVLDHAEQDRIIAALQGFIRERHLRPVRVQFMIYENWQQSGSFGTRGPETQMRLVRIDSAAVKEEEGLKQLN